MGGRILELESERLEKKGELKMLVKLVKNHTITIEEAARTAGITECEFLVLMDEDYK